MTTIYESFIYDKKKKLYTGTIKTPSAMEETCLNIL